MPAWSRIGAVLLVLLLAGCQNGPKPAPTAIGTEPPHEGTAAAPTSAVTPGPSADRSPAPLLDEEPVPPTTSVGKIRAAVAAGTIDIATGYLYRAYATVGDPKLPEDFRGDPSEDSDLYLILRTELATLPADVQAQLLPYLVRPSDPDSYWNQEVAPTAAAGLGRSRAAPSGTWRGLPLAVACVDGWMHDRVSSAIPVMLWSRCAFDPAAATARLEEARGYVSQLYGPETNLMGQPIGDRNVENDGYPDPPEGNDGLIDIYLVSGAQTDRNVNIPATVYGRAIPVPPFEGPANGERSSAYLVIRPSLTGLILKATIAHEFFHVLQDSHNALGRVDCPIAQLSTGCPSDAVQSHWFVEASAAWSEHYFVPEARSIADGPYPLWEDFIKTTNGLSFVDSANEYMSWPWALFMQQEWDADIIGNTWRAMRGKVGWWEIQRTLDAQLSFEQRFDDFAVRVFNRSLVPGDPINPRFRAPRLDPAFPLSTPADPRYNTEVSDDLSRTLVAPSTRYTYTITLNSLASAYFPFSPPSGAHTLRFEFAALAPEIEIDAIVRVGDTWERRELPASETVWCLDKPEDAVEEGFLIFSDHDMRPGELTRPWSVTAEQGGCSTPVGTLAYSFLDTAPMISAPGGSVAIDATVQVRLKQNENVGDPYAAMYLNDGSTYGVTEHDHTLAPPAPDGCQPTFNSTGTPGGALEIDSVVGNTWIDENDKWRLTLGIGLPVHYEVEEFWCALGSSHSTKEGGVTYPECDGIETASTPTTQTFVFDCDFQGTSQSWSVNGTIVISR